MTVVTGKPEVRKSAGVCFLLSVHTRFFLLRVHSMYYIRVFALATVIMYTVDILANWHSMIPPKKWFYPGNQHPFLSALAVRNLCLFASFSVQWLCTVTVCTVCSAPACSTCGCSVCPCTLDPSPCHCTLLHTRPPPPPPSVHSAGALCVHTGPPSSVHTGPSSLRQWTLLSSDLAVPCCCLSW